MQEIRIATPADAETINKIAVATWFDTYVPIIGREQVLYMLDLFYRIEKLQSQIASGEQTYILLFDNGEPVAFAAYSPRAENPDVYKLHKLYCLSMEQGRGYGRLLMQAVEKAVTNAGKTVLELNVNRNNKALTFYQKLGFHVAYDEDIDIQNGYWMNDHVMRKILKAE